MRKAKKIAGINSLLRNVRNKNKFHRKNVFSKKQKALKLLSNAKLYMSSYCTRNFKHFNKLGVTDCRKSFVKLLHKLKTQHAVDYSSSDIQVPFPLTLGTPISLHADGALLSSWNHSTETTFIIGIQKNGNSSTLKRKLVEEALDDNIPASGDEVHGSKRRCVAFFERFSAGYSPAFNLDSGKDHAKLPTFAPYRVEGSVRNFLQFADNLFVPENKDAFDFESCDCLSTWHSFVISTSPGLTKGVKCAVGLFPPISEKVCEPKVAYAVLNIAVHLVKHQGFCIVGGDNPVVRILNVCKMSADHFGHFRDNKEALKKIIIVPGFLHHQINLFRRIGTWLKKMGLQIHPEDFWSSQIYQFS